MKRETLRGIPNPATIKEEPTLIKLVRGYTKRLDYQIGLAKETLKVLLEKEYPTIDIDTGRFIATISPYKAEGFCISMNEANTLFLYKSGKLKCSGIPLGPEAIFDTQKEAINFLKLWTEDKL